MIPDAARHKPCWCCCNDFLLLAFSLRLGSSDARSQQCPRRVRASARFSRLPDGGRTDGTRQSCYASKLVPYCSPIEARLNSTVLGKRQPPHECRSCREHKVLATRVRVNGVFHVLATRHAPRSLSSEKRGHRPVVALQERRICYVQACWKS